jgi:hypothetical protein
MPPQQPAIFLMTRRATGFLVLTRQAPTTAQEPKKKTDVDFQSTSLIPVLVSRIASA